MPTRPASPAGPERPHAVAWAILASAAIGLPMLLAFNLPPSSTFLNQAAALIGWGAWLVVLAASLAAPAVPRCVGLAALQAALLVLAAAAFASPFWTGLPWSLALSAVAMVAAAMVAAQAGAALQRGGLARAAFRAFCIGMVVAGVLSSVVGIVQVFAPAWPDGNWVARTYMAGRAVGNMRQPNHLSSLLLWAIVAVVWLGEARVLRRRGAALLGLLFVFVVVLSASRTGALSMGLLLAWGALDRRLSRTARGFLCLAPLIYLVFWYGTGVWADHTHHVFGGETRFSGQGDISSSRWGIWSNTLALIRLHPWVGVGFGEFNFAWTLTPFPGRPVAFFDHTHNLALQFLVELGIPLGVTVMALLLRALWAALRGALEPAAADAPPGQALLRPAAFAMVLLILVHSLLEYPLWYAYFLLPAAFAFGLCLGRPAPEVEGTAARFVSATGPARFAPTTEPARFAPGATRPLLIAAMVLMVGGMASVIDYARVVVIFAPPEGAPDLAQRIVDGRRSVFFAHHADYAAATTSDRPAEVMPAFLRAPHYLLDARLLQAWATALDQAGDTQHARYVAQRLREFRNEASAEFFAPCAAPPVAGKPLPFQCLAPTREFRFEDFR
ncbi:MAG: Wzy polymerase domain-containing protein [Pseudomonadota bacterium]